MKNTTFRKKALLSSVAMLLVALVALGSATFAWFTTNPTVTAEGLKLQATAAAGLQIVSKSAQDLGADFDTTTVIKATKDADDKIVADTEATTLGTPISLEFGKASPTWWTASAAVETNYAMPEKDFSITGGAPEFNEVFYLRSSVDNGEEVTVTKATVQITKATNNAATKNLYNALRVTLVNNKDNSVIGTWAADSGQNKYLTETAVSTADTQFLANGASQDLTEFKVGYGELTYGTVTMYVWLDGEDPECFTANVETLKDLASKVTVQFTTK